MIDEPVAKSHIQELVICPHCKKELRPVRVVTTIEFVDPNGKAILATSPNMTVRRSVGTGGEGSLEDEFTRKVEKPTPWESKEVREAAVEHLRTHEAHGYTAKGIADFAAKVPYVRRKDDQ